MKRDDCLWTEVQGTTLIVTLNRPDVRNAFNRALVEATAAAMDRLDADSDLRAGVITGAGGNFCSGTDLRAYAEGDSMVIEPRGFYGLLGRPPRKPLIAAIEGYAAGGGLEVALACYLIVAARDARLGLPEVTHGVYPAGGAFQLPLRMPYYHAMELALTGRFISAERAEVLGLVNRVVEPGGTLRSALRLAAEIAANAPLAVDETKETIRRVSYHPSVEAAWTYVHAANERVLASEDSREGIAAFAERRRPVWRGR